MSFRNDLLHTMHCLPLAKQKARPVLLRHLLGVEPLATHQRLPARHLRQIGARWQHRRASAAGLRHQARVDFGWNLKLEQRV